MDITRTDINTTLSFPALSRFFLIAAALHDNCLNPYIQELLFHVSFTISHLNKKLVSTQNKRLKNISEWYEKPYKSVSIRSMYNQIKT